MRTNEPGLVCSVLMGTKSVLVCLGEHKRPVTFAASSDASLEKKDLQKAIAVAFEDVIGKSADPGSLLIQLKNEGWAGEFVDVSEGAPIPDSSVVRAVALDKSQVRLL